MIILFVLTYLEIGIAIGLQELGCAPQGKNAYSRRAPFFHVVLQCLLWPIIYLIVRSNNLFEKIVKLIITIIAVYFAQKYALAWLTPHLDYWVWGPMVVGGVLLVLGIFGFLRMPGFRPQF